MIRGGAIRSSEHFDTFMRQVVWPVLRWPHSLPRSIYYDQVNGIGLLSCELDANVHQYQEALRLLNTAKLPEHHQLVESLEAYQVNAGLTDNPLTVPIKPPIHVTTRIAQVIRFAAAISLHYDPTTACSQWANDKPLMFITPIALQTGLDATNWNYQFKLRSRLGLDCSLKINCVGKESGKVPNGETLICCTIKEGSPNNRSPVGWMKVPVGIAPYQLRIGVGDWGLNQSYITMNGVKAILVMLHVIHWEVLFQLGACMTLPSPACIGTSSEPVCIV
ncbi:hypothetical protein PHMEG_0004610 [Phytophthora megakarya]|uniref:Uncharacterized protein n=1 Tax=Phytophthora megakarya TaxID=4795 RepID=A0A225WTH1_9STRA|nr:hypothetical protein PHMEG_0004610 [Phytophthora megakarya]